MNRVVLAGRLTRDPELRYTPSGIAVARFTVAVTRPFRNQQGEQKTDFINCVAWRRQAENLAKYMRKGSLVGVDGRIQTDSYDDQDGKRVFVTEVSADQIHFLESRGASQQRSEMDDGFSQNDSYQQQESAPQPQQQQHQSQQAQPSYEKAESPAQNNPFENDGEKVEIADDDLPF